MKNARNSFAFQHRFVLLLKVRIPQTVNLARDLSDLLEISMDGAYRRLRCETAISLDEAVSICLHYSIPLEALNTEMPDVVTFEFSKLSEDPASFDQYLQNLVVQLQTIRRHPDARIHYAAEDVPMFYHFGYPALAAFKIFYWKKSILNIAQLDSQHFQVDAIGEAQTQTLHQLYDAYASVSGSEIWSDETIESTLQQIRFYWEAGFFKEPEDALAVLLDTSEMMKRMARQAETGQKLDRNGSSTGAALQVFLCDLMIGNNAIYAEMGETSASYIGYNTFNAIHTRNEAFNAQHKSWMLNLQSKSINISSMAEKIRNQFFKAQQRKIDLLRQHILEG